MAFMKIAPSPGLFTDGTRYSAEGTWYDSDKVRFRKGFAEKIGGWTKYVSSRYLGVSRKLHDWATDDGNNYIVVGTNLKLYVNLGDNYYDITPLRVFDNTTALLLGANPIAAVNNTSVITITCPEAHGAVAGDYVTIASAAETASIDAGKINTEHRIVALGDPNNANPDTKFRVVCSEQAGSTASGGGSSVTASFQINTGLNTYVEGSGWGADSWGSGTWGSSANLGQAKQLRLWSLVNFGDDMISNARQGNIFYWDESAGTGVVAKPLSDLTRKASSLGANPITTTSGENYIEVYDPGHGSGVNDLVTLAGAATTNNLHADRLNVTMKITAASSSGWTATLPSSGDADDSSAGGGSSVTATYRAGVYYTPVAATQVMISDVGRHVIAFGCNEIGATAINPLMVRWSTSENATEWRPRSSNSAGFQELSSCSEIVGALTGRQEILIWTDCGIISMRYIGSRFYFSFTEVAKGMSMISRNAAVNSGGKIYFMDRNGFYTYTGTAQKLACPISGTVFDDIDLDQLHKVVGGSNPDFSEVTWFYPSKSGNGENDKYVTHNYEENIWYSGTLVRGAWSHAGTKNYPLASSIRERTLSADPITTNTDATSNVSINSEAHGLLAGDEVIFEGTTTVGSLSTVVLNNQHTVVSVTDADNYVITIADTATATTGGGSSVKEIPANLLYNHENGHDDDGSAMTAYIETGDVDLGEGDQFWSVDRIIPDLQFRDAGSDDAVTISLNGHNFPGEAQFSPAPASVSIKPSTNQAFVRARARQLSMKVQSTGLGYGWRLGYVRLDGRTDGRR